MQQNERDQEEREAKEAAYRRGWTQSFDEAGRLILQLVELGYNSTSIKRLLAVYDDHFLTLWRSGDLSKREAAPPFDVVTCQTILSRTSGYDWIV